MYLLYFLTAAAGALLAKGIVVRDDAAATATHVLAHGDAFRASVAVGLVANVVYIALTALFYRLFVPVNRVLSLLAAFVSLVGCTVQIFAGLLQVAPLIVLRDAHLATAFRPEQLQAAALLALTLYSQTFPISLVLFAFYDLLLGYLIFRSTFLPRILGVLMMVAGAGWAIFLWPPLALKLSLVILPVGGLAEVLLMLWLLGKGIDVSRWREASRAVE